MSGYRYPSGGPPADLLVEGYGRTMEEAFAGVAQAMNNSITPLIGIKEREIFTIDVQGNDIESMLFNFLDELLFLADTEGLVAKSLDVKIDLKSHRVKATCRGERFSAKTHDVGISVKAVTYHMMKIEEKQGVWTARVVFDT